MWGFTRRVKASNDQNATEDDLMMIITMNSYKVMTIKHQNSESYFTSHSTFSIINNSKLNLTNCGRQLQTISQQWYSYLDSIINFVIIIHMHTLTDIVKYNYRLHSEPINSIFYTNWSNVFYLRSTTGANGHLKITSVQFTDNVICSWHFIINNLQQGQDTNLSKT